MKKVSKTIEFGPSKHNKSTLVPCKWFLDEVEVTEMEYYGITAETTISDIGEEPADMSEYQEWLIKKSIIEEKNNTSFFTF
jgi:hypothetical protein